MNLKRVKAMALATTMMVAALGSTSAFAAGETPKYNNDKSGQTKVKTELRRNIYTMRIPSVISISQASGDNTANSTISIKSNEEYPIEIHNDVEVTATSDTSWNLKRMTNRLAFGTTDTVDGGYTTTPIDGGGIPFKIEQGSTDLKNGIKFSANHDRYADIYTSEKGQVKDIITTIGSEENDEKRNPWWMEGEYEAVVTFNAKVVRNRVNDCEGHVGAQGKSVTGIGVTRAAEY